MLEGWMNCGPLNPWFWLNWWWNRFLCLLNLHMWVVVTNGNDEFPTGMHFCLICHCETT